MSASVGPKVAWVRKRAASDLLAGISAGLPEPPSDELVSLAVPPPPPPHAANHSAITAAAASPCQRLLAPSRVARSWFFFIRPPRLPNHVASPGRRSARAKRAARRNGCGLANSVTKLATRGRVVVRPPHPSAEFEEICVEL